MISNKIMVDILESITLLCSGGAKEQPSTSADEKNVAVSPVPAPQLAPVSPMNNRNYVLAQLKRPMGILFEENHNSEHGGAFVAKINEGYSAAVDGSIRIGDQLVAVGDQGVSGMDFDEIIRIIECSEAEINLMLFRGPAASLYDQIGSKTCLDDESLAEMERREEATSLTLDEDEFSVIRSEVTADDNTDAQTQKDLLHAVALAVAATSETPSDSDRFVTKCFSSSA